MSRLTKITADARTTGHKLLIPYLVAGDPDLNTTVRLMHALVAAGADIIELGIPFSDPSSDGPVIQRGVERALSRGTTLAETLSVVASFRETNQSTAIVLMGYLNPIEIMGYDQFTQTAQRTGVDGVLVVDMPPVESAHLHQILRKASIDTIYLAAPTTSAKRAEAIAEYSSGYLYYVSLKGVTGAALLDHQSVGENIKALRELTDLPIVIGFGIKDAESARAMAELADGVIIGSALVEKIADLTACSEISQGQIEATVEIIRQAREAIN